MAAAPGNTWAAAPHLPGGVAPHDTVKEVAMAAPTWLFSRWPDEGQRGGYMVKPPRAVIAHIINAHNTQGLGKYIPYKLYGWWWLQVDMALRGVLSG